MDLTELFPQPIPIDFAGVRLLARPLRLRQLAELQGWLKAFIRDPAEVAADALEDGDLDEEGCRRVLVGAYTDAEAWPIVVGTPAGDFVLDRWGRDAFLLVALRDLNPSLDPEEVGRLARAGSPAEWSRLMRAAFGPFDPCQTIARLIDPEAFAAAPTDDHDPPDWCKFVVGAMHDTGWTFEEVGELTLGQLAAFRSKCKPPDFDVPPRPGETREQAAARRMAYFDLDGEGATDGD